MATTSALTAVENEIPIVSNLVKKTNHDTKVGEIEKRLTDHNYEKYITTTEFNKLKLVQVDLVTKTGFDNKLTSYNRRIVSNKAKNLLNEKDIKKFKKFDLGYFIGQSYVDEDGAINS